MKNKTKQKKIVAKQTAPQVKAELKSGLVKTGCLTENFLSLTDSYKDGHWKMLPDETEAVYSYGESRLGAEFPYTVAFGLQMILKRYLEGVVVTQDDIEEEAAFCKDHFGMNIFNRKMWEYIIKKHNGNLPLRIKSVPEGMAIPVGNILITVENTGGKITAPLTNFVESLLTHVWHSSNVATISRDLKTYLKRAFDVSSDNPGMLPFMLHDFGFRGVSSVESAGTGGAGHLTSFMGTDNKIGIRYAMRYYRAGMAGFSVIATEHSVMTAKGEPGELEIIRNLLIKFPKGIISIVADSYNIKRVINEYLPALKNEIMARDGKTVIRPDSPRDEKDTPAAQILWLANSLTKTFGATINKKGYQVLDPHIGLIYGDGLKRSEIKECIRTLILAKWSAETCLYGMGGGLLQKHNRDTQRSAFKCSAQLQNGKWVDIRKNPLDKTKISKAGRMKLVWNEGIIDNKPFKRLETVPENDTRQDILTTVFENGKIVKDWTWNEVRANTEIKLPNET